jgi:hypothetical protein
MIAKFRLLSVLLACAAMAAACSGGDDDAPPAGDGTGGATGGSSGSGGSGGALTGILADCRAWCVAQDDCNPLNSVDDCFEYTCALRPSNPSGSIASATMACQSAYKAWWSCLIASGDPCTTPGPCETQAGGLAACAE